VKRGVVIVALLFAGVCPANSRGDVQRGNLPPRIDPALSILPANHLKFYLHFFRPMERGAVFQHLRLVEIDASGKEVAVVPEPFREVELWDETFTRMTIWFHPGRQKPGVNLNVEIGPILEEGKRYRLELSRNWRDEDGRPMDWLLRHEFLAGPPDETQPDPAKWTIATEGGLVRVTTDGPLDPESLRKRVMVRPAGEGVALAVTVEADAGGFTMRRAGGWPAGAYRLIVDPRLEDLAGNSVARPFNVDLEKGAVKEGETVEVGFVVRRTNDE